MLHIYYGDGKGKTTAAMGLALRALGHAKHVTILQFLKDGSSGEIALLRRCGADVHACPNAKFTWLMTVDKQAAYLTLHETLITIAKLIAPFTPFLAEEIFTNLEPGSGSVHMQDYPKADEWVRDVDLERQMDLARQVVYLGRAARNEVNIKNRQPLLKVVVGVTPEEKKDLRLVEDLVKDELNIKRLEYAQDMSEFLSYRVKPRYDLLGPKHGKLMKAIAEGIAEADASQIAGKVLKGREFGLVLSDGTEVSILPEEVSIQTVAAEGYYVQSEGGRAIALDTVITEDLKLEGFARELVNKIQTTRKEAGFDVSDRICTVISGGPDSMRALEVHRDYLMKETLSVSLAHGEPEGEYVREWDVNGEKVAVGVRRAS